MTHLLRRPVATYAFDDLRVLAGPSAADDVDMWTGIGASAAAVAISAGLMALLAMTVGPPERRRAL